MKTTDMMFRHPPAWRPTRAALRMRWLVVLVFVFGTIMSSVGGLTSHGLAAVAAASHAAPTDADSGFDHAHGHSHEDESEALILSGLGVAADHPHHGADHSHDKAHALPVNWHAATPSRPGRFGLVRPWVETVQAYRLERPPMG